MTKDNLVFGFGGMVIGLVLGVLVANSTGSRSVTGSNPHQNLNASSAPAQTSATQQELPEGHPPIDEATIKKQIADYEQLIRNDPENVQALVALGNLNYDLKNFQEATNWYEKALQKNPNDINILTDLGTSYFSLDQTDKAMEYYNKSLSIDPDHFQTLVNVGIARMSLGDRKGAAEAWEKVVRLHPEHPEVPMLKQALEQLKSENP